MALQRWRSSQKNVCLAPHRGLRFFSNRRVRLFGTDKVEADVDIGRCCNLAI